MNTEINEPISYECTLEETLARQRGYGVKHWAAKLANVTEAPVVVKPLRVALRIPLPKPVRVVTNIRPPAKPREKRLCADCSVPISKSSTRCNKCASKIRKCTDLKDAPPRICADCPSETGSPWAVRCEPCAAKRKRVTNRKCYFATNSNAGIRKSMSEYDMPAVRIAFSAKRKGLSVAKVAVQIGLSRSLLDCFERGGCKLSTPKLRLLCNWLGVEPETFRRGEVAA